MLLKKPVQNADLVAAHTEYERLSFMGRSHLSAHQMSVFLNRRTEFRGLLAFYAVADQPLNFIVTFLN